MTDQTITRTRWQAVARKKYPRLTFIGGDGGTLECWVVMTKCPHQQTKSWRYTLRPTKAEAEAMAARWDTERCAYTCQGKQQHSLWRIYE